MLVGGIYFGEKTIWDEIIHNMKKTGLLSYNEIDRLKEETEEEKEPNELDVLVESLLNYKDVLEGKVRELEQEHEKLKEALEISVERKEKLMNIIGENNTEIEKLHAEIERQDEEIEQLKKNDGTVMYNQLLENTEGEARELFVRHFFYNLKCIPVNQECDCGNLKKKIEELQSEVRDLTSENVKLATTNSYFNNVIHENKRGIELIDKCYVKLKKKYETADLEREHLAKELGRLRELVKELNERHQQDCIDLNKKQTTINELVDSYSELRRMKGLSE